jgi:hypothetical protein
VNAGAKGGDGSLLLADEEALAKPDASATALGAGTSKTPGLALVPSVGFELGVGPAPRRAADTPAPARASARIPSAAPT